MTDAHAVRQRDASGALLCLNCAAPLSGSFCSACGQRDIPPYPSTRELVVEAVSEFSGWDGRLANTLRALVRAPGVLTLEFLEGRRVRYISPLRLYLTMSVVYFLLAASSPTVRLESGEPTLGGLRVGTSVKNESPTRPERVANAARESFDDNELTPAQRDSTLADIARAPAVLRPFLRRAVLDPKGFKRGILENLPRLLFVLLPIFAAIVGIFYRHRKYPEHLYFAIHLFSFVFLALSIVELAKFSRLPVVAAIVSFAALLSIAIYATLAFRRVYGSSIGGTIVREIGIGLLYSVVAGISFVVMIYWVSIAG